MVRTKAAAATVALLLILLLGAGEHAKKANEPGQGIRAAKETQTAGAGPEGTAGNAKGTGTYETLQQKQNWARPGTIFRLPAAAGTGSDAAVQGSLGIGKADKPGEHGMDTRAAEEPGEGSPASLPAGANDRGDAGADPNDGHNRSMGRFTITAYTAGYESTQKKKGEPGYGITYSGTKVKEGRTIAADPHVLPIGTRVKIEGLAATYVVEDIGGAVDGKHIDLFIADLDRALAWGKQQKEVTIIEWGRKSK